MCNMSKERPLEQAQVALHWWSAWETRVGGESREPRPKRQHLHEDQAPPGSHAVNLSVFSAWKPVSGPISFLAMLGREHPRKRSYTFSSGKPSKVPPLIDLGAP